MADLTIVVPTLDSHTLLPRLVDSLRAQALTEWQVLFIDGPSGREHRAWLDALCRRDPRFSWQPQDRAFPGIFGAMNQGFDAAPAHHWLLFWGSDDWAASPVALERAMAATHSAGSPGRPPDLVVCKGRYATIGPNGEIRLGRRTAFADQGSYRLCLFLGSTPPHQACLIGPGARSRLNRYAQRFRLSADLDYFLRLSACPDLEVRRLNLELVHMGAGGTSGIQTRRRLQEVRLAYRSNFRGLWWIPFCLRYGRRIWSRLEPNWPFRAESRSG